mgnify:CR=1 FL=1
MAQRTIYFSNEYRKQVREKSAEDEKIIAGFTLVFLTIAFAGCNKGKSEGIEGVVLNYGSPAVDGSDG